MNFEIKVIDNFLSKKDLEKIDEEYNGYGPIWALQVSNFEDKLPFLYYDVTYNNFFNNYLYNNVAKKLDEDEYELARVYFNGQWDGREGSIHQDGCDFTAILYLGEYEYGWGGFTEIMTKPEPTLIHPVPNRLVIFPGNIPHKAYSFAYQECPLRVSLAFKINKK